MRLRVTGAHAAVFMCLAAAASCFPDPPPDEGLADGGIFISEGGPGGGDATVNGLVVSASTIDFGLAECGGQAPAHQTITLTNVSSSEVSYAVAPSGPQFQVVSTSSGKIAAGATFDVELSASPVSPFATAGGLVEGALQIVTDAPGQKLFTVDLRETAEGASLVVIPGTADFGLAPFPSTNAMDVALRNNGNEPITITFDNTATGNFTLDTADGGGIVVGGNSTTKLHATWAPDGDSPSIDVIGFHTTGTICGGGDPPASIILQGHVGYPGPNPSITPGVLAFDVGGTGFVPCGQTASSQQVTVSNPVGTSYDPVTVTETRITGPFTVSPAIDVADGGPGLQLAAGTSQAFTVTPLAVNAPASTLPDGASGTLEIDLDNENSLIVNLSQTAQGAVFSFNPSTQIDFGAASIDTLATQLLGITNSGNAAASITLGVAGSPYFTAFPSSQFSVNTPGTQATVAFLPLTSGAQTATLSMTTSGTVCGLPLPPSITLTGNGILPTDSGSDSGSDSGGDSDSGADADDGGFIDEGGINIEAGLGD